MQPRYIDPKTDYGFKLIFGHHDILLAFINTVLPKADAVKRLTYASTEVVGHGPAGRVVIYDLRCVTEDGRTIIVEVQRLPQPFFKERSLYYTMRSLDLQVSKGDPIYEILPVYLIAVVDFDLPGDYTGYLHHFTLKNQHQESFSDVLQLYFLELNKFTMSDTTDVLDPLEQWTQAIRSMPALDGIPDWVTDEDLRKAFTVAEVGKLTDAERAKWERAFREDRDLRGQVLQQYIWGKTEGREEGRRDVHRDLALKRKAAGDTPEQIAELLDVELGYVQELLKSPE